MKKMIQSEMLPGYQPKPPARPPSRASSRRNSSRVRPPSREKTKYDLFESGDDPAVDYPERDMYSRASSTAVSRPSSSLSKYKPLPPIGFHQEPEISSESFVESVSDSLKKLQINVSVPSTEKPVLVEKDPLVSQNITSVDSGSNRQNKTLSGNHKNSSVNRQASGKSTVAQRLVSSFSNSSEKHSADNDSENSMGQNISTNTAELTRDEQRKFELALKLPNGERLQGNFNFHAKLETVMEFVEKESGQNFKGFSFIQNTPKKVFTDLSQTLSQCGITDKTVLYVDED